MIKALFLVFPLAVFIQPAFASQQSLAEQVLEASDAQATLRAEFDASIQALAEKLSAADFPAKAVDEIRTAMNTWYEREIKWEELRPRLAASYSQNFTEEELSSLLEFFQTPLGRKVALRLPSVGLETAALRESYAKEKQPTLDAAIQEIIRRHKR